MIRLIARDYRAKSETLRSFSTKAEACAYAVECVRNNCDSVFMYDFNGFGVFGTKDPDAWTATIYSGERGYIP